MSKNALQFILYFKYEYFFDRHAGIDGILLLGQSEWKDTAFFTYM
ncbi:hypothetical protein LJR153_005282 [Paenibacillus sp. LjRoot153]